MRNVSRISLAFLFLVTPLTLLCAQPASAPSPDYGKIPLAFELNQGQAESQISFLTHSPGYSIFLTRSQAILALGPAQAATGAIRMSLTGASNSATPIGESPLPGKANYFLGEDPSHWHADVPTFARVRYPAVYPGIDLVYYGNQRQLEYDFIVAPGASPAAIRLHFAGAAHPRLRPNGELVLTGHASAIAFRKPLLYQPDNGRQLPVQGSFRLLAGNTVAFTVGPYNHALPLVIDPVLVYSTYLSGASANGTSGQDQGNGIAVDAQGNAYVVGATASASFPTTTGAYQTRNNAPTSVFIAKFNATGSALLYSTYLGGSGIVNAIGNPTGDRGLAIAIDAAGNAYVTGAAVSTDFPVTKGAFQTANKQASLLVSSAFVTKLNPAGNALVYSTYLGGTDTTPSPYLGPSGDGGSGIAVDASGNAYIAGYTSAANFPVTAGAFQHKYPGAATSASNAFVAKLNPTGTALVYSTFLGGSGLPAGSGLSYNCPGVNGDAATAIAINASGEAYIAGSTCSDDFPTTPGALQTANAASKDHYPNGFITRLNATGAAALFSTYLGGSSFTQGGASYPAGAYIQTLALDSGNNVYVGGYTAANDFPVTAGVVQPVGGEGPSGYDSGFVSKLDPTGATLDFSTYLGSDVTSVNALAVDPDGEVYAGGSTISGNFPLTPDAVVTSFDNGYRSFLARLNATATAIQFSTLFGSSFPFDGLNALTLDANGNVYATGAVGNTLPTTAGAFQTTANPVGYNGGNTFVSKFNLTGEVASLFETTTTFQPTAAQYTFGKPVTLTVRVAPSAGKPTPTGKVTFYASLVKNGVATAIAPVTVTLSNSGVATWTTSSLALGEWVVGAAYLGNAASLTSSSPVSADFTVVDGPTQVKIYSQKSQAGVYGKPLIDIQVQVLDSNNDLLPGVTVQFSGAGLRFTPASVVTDKNGLAMSLPIATQAGSLTATASVSGVTTPATFTITVAPAPLTVTVLPSFNSRTYGAANPTITDTVTGLLGSDTVHVANSLAATPASPVGAYPITATVTAGPGTVLSNYALSINENSLHIRPAPLYIEAANETVVYGHNPAAPTAYKLVGFVNGDTAAVVTGAPVLTTTVTSTTPVGVYRIGVQPGTLTAVNYTFSTVSNAMGAVTVTHAPLTLKANNLTMVHGSPVPTLTYTLTGFLNGDTQATAVTGAPSLSTTATSASRPGTYPITIATGTLASTNYAFTKVNGVLTVQ